MGRHPSRRHVSPEEAPAGHRIRARRRELGLTQAELAGEEYTKSFISQLESGSAEPSLDTLRFLGRRLQLGLSTMAGDDTDQRLSLLAGLLSWAERAAGLDPDAARRALGLAQEIAREGGAETYAADALLRLADLEMHAGALDRAAAHVLDAAGYAGAPGSRIAARVALAGGRLALRRGDPAAAMPAFLQAAGTARRTVRHPDVAVEALIGLAACCVEQRDLRQARRRLQSAVTLAARHHLPSHGRALIRLAMVDGLTGRVADALTSLRRANDLLAGAADQRDRIDALLGIGLLLLERGETRDAAHALGEARDLARRLGEPSRECDVAIAQARAALAVADVDAASRLVAEARALSDGARSPSTSARIDAVTGRVLSAQGRHAEAVGMLAGALALIEAARTPGELAEAARAMGHSARASGDPDTAARHLALAERVARARRPTPWLNDLA
ncbi:MAG: helix-turn-helix transcriptional regulator [Armatimonadota bacterium]|nr:helix-turn-helix transcriptional regulator [Armatimonadota bacterium]